MSEVVDYCKKEFAQNVEEVLRIAEDITNYTFLFETKWELERTYTPVVYKDKKVKWDEIPFDDPEWVFAMNRHRFFVTLSQAYALTGDEKYTECFIDILKQWIQENPLTKEKTLTTWRTIEAGLRCENWLKAHKIFKHSPLWTEEWNQMFLESIKVHAEYILSQNDDFRRLSNWGVIENHGLFLVGALCPELKNNRTYVEVAKERLEKAMALQVMSDGCHWEQSQCYHNEVLRAFLDVALCANEEDINLSENFHRGIEKMLYVTIYMAKPNWIQLANGDSDEIDARDLLVKAAYLYKNPHFKALGCEQVDFESIWDIGMDGKRVYDSIQGELPKEKSKALEEGGHYCLRNSWKEDAFYLHFKCGSLGGGHGHVDMLHIDLMYKGEDLLLDQGRYTYVDSKERYYLKSGEAHNTVLIDNKPFTEIVDTWGYSKVAHPIQRKAVFDDVFDYVEGAHLGYMQLENPVLANRKVLYIKPNILIVSDEFYGEGEHEYTQYFHFGEGNVEIGDSVFYKGKKAQMMMHFMGDTKKELKNGISSKYYNQLDENTVLKVKTKNKGFTAMTTVFILDEAGSSKKAKVQKIPLHIGDQQTIPDYIIEGIKISYDNKEYVITVKHNEWVHGRQLIHAENHCVYGRVTLNITEDGKIISKRIF